MKLCEEKTEQQLSLEGLGDVSGGSPGLPRKSPRRDATLATIAANKEYHRKYHQEHKAQWREYNRTEYRRNIGRYRRTRGTEEYKAKARMVSSEWRAKNPERQKASMARWAQEHKEYTAAYRKAQGPRRRELYRGPLGIKDRTRSRIRMALKSNGMKKSAGTEKIIGCTREELIAYIESQFVNGMRWELPKSYHLDHIVPVSAFKLTDPEEFKWAFNWRNMQPLSPHDNWSKQDKLTLPLPSWLPLHIAERVKGRGAI